VEYLEGKEVNRRYKRVADHLGELEERVARLEAEMDHMRAAECGCDCGKDKKKWNINPERTETIWTFGPNIPTDRP
jgi:hypothetical protein